MRAAVMTAAILIALGFGAAGQTGAGREVHITLHEGTNMAAALSPDGRTIAIDLLGTLWTLPANGGPAPSIRKWDPCQVMSMSSCK